MRISNYFKRKIIILFNIFYDIVDKMYLKSSVSFERTKNDSYN